MIKVLDHGFVRLVDSLGNDLSVVRSARVSYAAEWRTGEDSGSDSKLIRFLLRNSHTSPFEHVSFTFDVKAPIFVLRQWHRHRTWSFNEVSARYTELPEEYYIPEVKTIGVQSVDNKQVRDLSFNDNSKLIGDYIDYSAGRSYEYYIRLIELGCPRELARIVLPLNTYSHMFATVNLHNLLKFIENRSHPHAQWEIQQYANALLNLITPIVPETIKAYKEIHNGTTSLCKVQGTTPKD